MDEWLCELKLLVRVPLLVLPLVPLSRLLGGEECDDAGGDGMKYIWFGI